MSTFEWAGTIVAAGIVFLILDLTWLGVVANGYYRTQLGDLMADKPNLPAAVAFYVLFLLGLAYFALRPAFAGGTGDLGEAAVNGAIYGLMTYGTWDLTNAAVLRGFPTAIVPVDMAWGTALSCLVAVSATWIGRTLFLSGS